MNCFYAHVFHLPSLSIFFLLQCTLNEALLNDRHRTCLALSLVQCHVSFPLLFRGCFFLFVILRRWTTIQCDSLVSHRTFCSMTWYQDHYLFFLKLISRISSLFHHQHQQQNGTCRVLSLLLVIQPDLTCLLLYLSSEYF